MKRFDKSDLSLNQLNIMRLRKQANLLSSSSLIPVLVLQRELFTLDYSHEIKERFVLYMCSPFDEHFLKLKLFNSKVDFCLWYVSHHPYKDFLLVNYSEFL